MKSDKFTITCSTGKSRKKKWLVDTECSYRENLGDGLLLCKIGSNLIPLVKKQRKSNKMDFHISLCHQPNRNVFTVSLNFKVERALYFI